MEYLKKTDRERRGTDAQESTIINERASMSSETLQFYGIGARHEGVGTLQRDGENLLLSGANFSG